MNTDTITQLVIALPVLLIAITLHEMMHAFVSDKLGDDTARNEGRITFNPLAHIDPILTIGLPLFLIAIGAPPFGAARPVPMNPQRIKYDEFGVAIVALAGPLTNLLIAIIAAGVLRVVGFDPNSVVSTFLVLNVTINVGFFVFNMIPFPPLDGSRLLFAFAPNGLQKVMLQIESLGFLSIAIFMFLLFPFIRPAIAGVTDILLRTLF